MYRLLVIISLSGLCRGSEESVVNPKIVGGTDSQGPHVVSIYVKPDIFLCAGVIISKRVIATSARCLDGMSASSLYVRSGSTTLGQGGTVSSVEKFEIHWGWSYGSHDNDVGALVLANKLDKNAKAIPLAKAEVADGESVVLSGWGAEKHGGPLSKSMKTVTVRKMGREDCKHIYLGRYNITNRMICGLSPGKGPCSGDFGGPVTWNKKLVGIISFQLNCGKDDSPSVFTNVPARVIRKFLTYMEKIYG